MKFYNLLHANANLMTSVSAMNYKETADFRASIFTDVPHQAHCCKLSVLGLEKISKNLVWFGLVWLCGPWILRSSDGISHFSGIFPLAQGGLNPLQPGNWSSRLPHIRC